MTETMENKIRVISEVNCHDCPHYHEDLGMSPCICELVLELVDIAANEMGTSEDFACAEWERQQQEYRNLGKKGGTYGYRGQGKVLVHGLQTGKGTGPM